MGYYQLSEEGIFNTWTFREFRLVRLRQLWWQIIVFTWRFVATVWNEMLQFDTGAALFVPARGHIW